VLHLKDLLVYITIEARPALIREAGAADALLGCGFDDGKAAASRRTPKCPHRAAVVGADDDENCGLDFAMQEIKKAAEKLPQSEKPTPLPRK
jgi:hypothetical protein